MENRVKCPHSHKRKKTHPVTDKPEFPLKESSPSISDPSPWTPPLVSQRTQILPCPHLAKETQATREIELKLDQLQQTHKGNVGWSSWPQSCLGSLLKGQNSGRELDCPRCEPDLAWVRTEILSIGPYLLSGPWSEPLLSPTFTPPFPPQHHHYITQADRTKTVIFMGLVTICLLLTDCHGWKLLEILLSIFQLMSMSL